MAAKVQVFHGFDELASTAGLTRDQKPSNTQLTNTQLTNIQLTNIQAHSGTQAHSGSGAQAHSGSGTQAHSGSGTQALGNAQPMAKLGRDRHPQQAANRNPKNNTAGKLGASQLDHESIAAEKHGTENGTVAQQNIERRVNPSSNQPFLVAQSTATPATRQQISNSHHSSAKQATSGHQPLDRGQSAMPSLRLGASAGTPLGMDWIQELKQMRIEPDSFPGLRSHQFASPELPAHALQNLERLGHQFYKARLVDNWTVSQVLVPLLSQFHHILLAWPHTLQMQLHYPFLFSFEIDPNQFPILPRGYAFKGGVARKALARALRLDSQTSEVRDMDVVHIGQQSDPEVDLWLSKSYMQDDWIFSKNSRPVIEFQATLKHYFRSREFTLNQAILLHDQVICTAPCICDLLCNTIRTTVNHRHRHGGHTDGIVAAKAIRFFVEGLAEGRSMRLDNHQLNTRRRIRLFHLAVHFSRALERGDDVGLAFLNEAIRRNRLRLKFNGTVADAIRKLRSQLRQEEQVAFDER